MERTVVFFDIDMTLVGKDRKVPPDTLAAVRKLRENGHLAAISTGRPYTHIEKGVLAIGFDGFVCECGAHVIYRGEDIFHAQPELPVCREMIELSRRTGMSPVYESEEGMFFDTRMPFAERTRIEREHYAALGFDVDRDIDDPDFRFDKFVVYQLPGNDIETFCREAGKYFEIYGKEGGMWEMVPKGCSKGRGIERLCERLDIPPERCLAVGDGLNDAAMFQTCGHSAVMGDGDPAVFPLAEFISAGYAEGGVRNALEHFGLI